MRLQLIRHATLKLEIGGRTVLVDPMLAEQGSTPPIQNGPDDRNNPLVGLPMGVADLLKDVDAVLVTHTHRDHWDAVAAERIQKHIPMLCQPEDEKKFREAGFKDVRPVHDSVCYSDVEISRTAGQHGTGEIGRMMAPVSGFVLSHGGVRLYIAGDTIFCDEVLQAIALYRPTHIVVNAGGARFRQGDPITMTAEDVEHVCHAAPHAQIIAVHMESINHCLVTRAALNDHLATRGLQPRVAVPNDGEWLNLLPVSTSTRATGS